MMHADNDAVREASTPELLSLQPSPEASAALQQVGRLSADLPDPSVGQFWRAAWGGESVLGLVLAAEDGFVEFAPATVDVDYADSFAAIVTGDDGPLPITVAVFARLTTPLPRFTLQKYLGDVDAEVADDIVTLWRGSLFGERPKVDVITGGLDIDDLEVRREFYSELTQLIGKIASADLSPESGVDVGDIVSLPDLLKQAGVPPSKLADVLAVPLSDARSIAAGYFELTLEQAELIAPMLGDADPFTLAFSSSKPLSKGVVSALNNPRRFSIVRELAEEKNIDEVAAARMVPALIAARRQDNPREEGADEAYWVDALDRFLAR